MMMIMIIIIMMIDEADHDDDSDDQERWNIEPERSEIWLGRDLQHRRAVPGGRLFVFDIIIIIVYHYHCHYHHHHHDRDYIVHNHIITQQVKDSVCVGQRNDSGEERVVLFLQVTSPS